MATYCVQCETKKSSSLKSSSRLKCTIGVLSNAATRISSSSSIVAKNTTNRSVNARLIGQQSIKVKSLTTSNAKANIGGLFGINVKPKFNLNLKSINKTVSNFNRVKADKFAGNIDKIKSLSTFNATQKLYPIRDIVTYLNNSYFVDKNLQTSGLFSQIDEGVYVGQYVKNNSNSVIISDDKASYIQPSSIFTKGDFRYKFEVTKPNNIEESFLFIRASAPTSNYSSDIPPQYRLHNIKLEDPSGNLIIKYKDIIIRGDADYSTDYVNFATYISEPETNNLKLNIWDSNYPIMDLPSGYSLNIDFAIDCLDDPFTEGFDKGYEDTCKLEFVNTSNNDYLSIDGSPLSTQSQNFSLNPTNSIRISSIEIANSGGAGILEGNYLDFYTEVSSIGQRLVRKILPSDIISYNDSLGIYPSGYSTWKTSSDDFGNFALNASASGNGIIISKLREDSLYNFIQLIYSEPVSDSGRLSLKFSHSTPGFVDSLADGAFTGAYSNDYYRAVLQSIQEEDNLFVIDDIKLKVIAKKEPGSRDFALDVVGFSDDKLLNVTSKTNAFLQNKEHGQGAVPLISGFADINDLGISTETLSDKSQYFENYLVTNPAGDHYKLSTTPLVTGTSFAEYIVPLKIYQDVVGLGSPKNYSVSSNFENLYLDIYNIPSGATIATAQLIITYKPSNALSLNVFAQEALREYAQRNITLLPSSRQSDLQIFDTGYDEHPLSRIPQIPEAYSKSTKTNYSKRWRGVGDQIVNGPFDARSFDYCFYNPPIEHPFLQGYFNFANTSGNTVFSKYLGSGIPVYSGTYVGNLQDSIINNLGNRLRNNDIFSSIPARDYNYRSIDWATGTDSLLSGKISDSFEYAIRTSGDKGYLELQTPVQPSSGINFNGFGVYLRFTPDINNIGSGYNLFNSGIIFAKYDDNKTFDYVLCYEDEYLCLKYNNNRSIKDNKKYYEYSYPLNVLITFGEVEANSSEFVLLPFVRNSEAKLYTSSDSDNSELLKASGVYDFNSSNSSTRFTIGHCLGSGVGLNCFIHEVGIAKANYLNSLSSFCNITSKKPVSQWSSSILQIFAQLGISLDFSYHRNNVLKYILVEDFFKTISNKYWNSQENSSNDKNYLYSYIDEDVDGWKIGDFKLSPFSPDFYRMTTRNNADYLVHTLNSDGAGYLQVLDRPVPSSINLDHVSYHTQIENDFLRFYLSDIPEQEKFYSAYPRISKNIPRNYNFYEDALRVETVIEHDTLDNIVWPNGKIGPKLIVSLYTTSKDLKDRPSIKNHGLVSRSSHYLEPSGGIIKLTGSLKYDDILDTSEPWSNFDTSILSSEFDHKYMSKDINDMYLQYDLVYPSGRSFSSTVKIHSASIKLENAIRKLSDTSSNINLATSGDLKALSQLDLNVYGSDFATNTFNIFVDGTPAPSISDSLSLYSFGAYFESANLPMNIVAASSGVETLSMFVGARTSQSDVKTINVFSYTDPEDYTSRTSLNIFAYNKPDLETISSNISLAIEAISPLRDKYITSSIGLFSSAINTRIFTQENSVPLYIGASGLFFTSDNSLSLYTINYPPINYGLNEQQTISWNSTNPGKNITVIDNDEAYLEANDEIRGVDLMCYGPCDKIESCQEESVVSHDVVWSPEDFCVDGGIFRAKNTYTNLSASGFKTDIGYSGHFYGIRKYDGLIPKAPYSIIVAGQTGSNKRIEQPFTLTEVEYGSNEYVNFSGAKIVYPEIQPNSKYGKSISIKNDLMAVGAPLQNLEYEEYDKNGNIVNYNLDGAGSVFVYRKSQAPSGYSWPIGQDKGSWNLEAKLSLPSSILKDYYTSRLKFNIDGKPLPLPVTERFWEVGQEGREFGHSVAVASTSGYKSFQENRREIAVVGAPNCKWQPREFDDLQTSGVQIGMLVFTDEFTPAFTTPSAVGDYLETFTYESVIDAIKNKDAVFKYFSNPPVSFDVKVIICEPLSDYTNRIPLQFPEPKPNFIVKKVISRNQGIVREERVEKIVSGIKDAFHEAFPYDPNKLNNNIPVILGVTVDSTRSMLNAIDGTVPALDRFISYYRNYSFASGLRDFYGTRASGEVVKLTPPFPQHWITLTRSLFNHVLDTGRLLTNNQVRFFSSGIGLEGFNTNLSQFNYPPDSGGKVFIFEKESGVWNLIQEIKSSTITYEHPDRFGHAVGISDNTEVIAIGSPYITESCQAYEYKPSEKARLFDQLFAWVSYKSSASGGVGRYAKLVENYYKWLENSDPGDGFRNSTDYANKTLYANLSKDEKFEARKYLNIQEYANIFKYDQGKKTGFSLWSFIEEQFLPTPRLGYSVAVNEDGSILAFGAPTDSLNKWDDVRVYYKNRGYNNKEEPSLNTIRINPSWSSSVNAGAVRLFESRMYYPHNKVIEYGKFGNLQKEIGLPEDSGHFNYLSTVFANKNFEVTPFSQASIPQDAGLAFIITPSVDSASDEITDNIIDWLALGDRNLVLVGNDPIWESSGIYNESNNIINKILQKLDSRMKLYPAKNEYEACVSGYAMATPVIVDNATETYIEKQDVNIRGVADIRTNFDNLSIFSSPMFSPCREEIEEIGNGLELVFPSPNDKCELPIKNNGDLRAAWKKICISCNGKRLVYTINYPYMFSTYTPGCRCDVRQTFINLIPSRVNGSGQEPLALLAAARKETITDVIPAAPAQSGMRPITIDKNVNVGTTIFEFGNVEPSSVPHFMWSPELSYNINLESYNSSVITPEPSPIDGSSGVMQIVAEPISETVQTTKRVSEFGHYCVQETIYNSILIAIAGTVTESEDCLYNASSGPSFNNDENISFYVNMVSKSLAGESNIVFLSSDWVGRSSFSDAYQDSVLYEVFTDNGNSVQYRSRVYSSDDVCWIANPLNLPSKDELDELIAWLRRGNKRLIVTHDSTLKQMSNVNALFKMLNSSIESLFLPIANTYPIVKFDNQILPLNRSHFISTGFNNRTSLNAIRFSNKGGFIPFKLSNNIVPIVYDSRPINQIEPVSNGFWRIDGKLKLTVPHVVGSGYKLFIDIKSESPYDNQKLIIETSDVSKVPSLPVPEIITNYYEEASETKNIVVNLQTKPDIKKGGDVEFFISSKNLRINDVVGYIPKTPKLISISGVLVPINSKVVTRSYIEQVIVGYEPYLIKDAQPERIVTKEIFDHIKNNNSKYCSEECANLGYGNRLIADGPVVVAQEQEHITSFIAGHNRSRITLISDSALVQGGALSGGSGVIPYGTLRFLQSLYPNTDFASTNKGRHFTQKTKIVSPERSSPQKYISLTKNSGLSYRFGQFTMPTHETSEWFNNIDSEYDPRYVIYPGRPWPEDATDEEIARKKSLEIGYFIQEENFLRAKSKLIDVVDGKVYTDVKTGLPDILKETGKDHIDLDVHHSGYPGDLFGYSIALYKNKLVVGAPFVGFDSEEVYPWDHYIANSGSGITVSFNGGAGSVYVFEKTFNGSGLHGSLTPWEFTQKLRPKSINVGQDVFSEEDALDLENNNYNVPFLSHNSIITDRFGQSVAIDSDVIIVGAPGHDYSNVYINGNSPIYTSGYGDFIRKAFNEEFGIPSREVIDLGSSGNRLLYPNSGTYVPNNGAVFVFENRIIDWSTKNKKWVFAEKIVQSAQDRTQGIFSEVIDGGSVETYNSTTIDANSENYNLVLDATSNDIVSVSGSENASFGSAVAVDRTFRTDSDYVVASAPRIDISGYVYAHDIMLRQPTPITQNKEAYIHARVFGERDAIGQANSQPNVFISITNSGQDSIKHFASGTIYSDNKGQIFLEVSGQDPAVRGFISHRPFIASVDGQYSFGVSNSDNLSLYVDGSNFIYNSADLFTKVDDSANVYNSLGMYNGSIIDIVTNLPSGLSLYVNPDPKSVENNLNLFASGIGSQSDALNMRIRGKA